MGVDEAELEEPGSKEPIAQREQEVSVMLPTFGSLYFSRRQTLRVALSAFLCRKSASRSILKVTTRSCQICNQHRGRVTLGDNFSCGEEGMIAMKNRILCNSVLI